MVNDLGSEQSFVRTDQINTTKINDREMFTTLCYYGDKHPCSTAWVRIEITKNDEKIILYGYHLLWYMMYRIICHSPIYHFSQMQICESVCAL